MKFPSYIFNKIYSIAPKFYLNYDLNKMVINMKDKKACWNLCKNTTNSCCSVNKEKTTISLFPGELEFLKKKYSFLFVDYKGAVPKKWPHASKYLKIYKDNTIKCCMNSGKNCFGGLVGCRIFPFFVDSYGLFSLYDLRKLKKCPLIDMYVNPEPVIEICNIAIILKNYMIKIYGNKTIKLKY